MTITYADGSSFDFGGTTYVKDKWYKESVTRPLPPPASRGINPYLFARGEVSGTFPESATYLCAADIEGVIPSPIRAYATERAHEALIQAIHSNAKASLGQTAVEWNKTLSTVASTVETVLETIYLARKGRWADVAKVVADVDAYGPNSKRYIDLKDPAKSVANKWLTVTYGLAPTIQDARDACNVFGRPFVFGGRKAYGRSFGTASKGIGDLNGYNDFTFERAAFVSCEVGAIVRVTNPNLLLASELGVINPALIAWQVTPWSFLVDQVIDISSYLSSLTDEMGFGIESSYHVIKCVATELRSHFRRSNTYDPWEPSATSPSAWRRGYEQRRVPGLPGRQRFPGLLKLNVNAASMGNYLMLAIQNGSNLLRS